MRKECHDWRATVCSRQDNVPHYELAVGLGKLYVMGFELASKELYSPDLNMYGAFRF